ncbi:hypothetical protein SAMN06264364_10149 [Quadrisphaera granulorum]|uniref:Glycosyl transferase family 2 n=1 Tax=Quadrisphaera granulorum TaxID=317664 RepID=A0A316AE66_9ACTN|nr:hypothetical protein [Quadrisphaera granulorum]PWJ56075.1 hypothetical protein BXY45_10149 [Quadrisphaera granulorum]SZE94709.1 hypothetical protein SAMN06264364_10149 [Quadrisphaera granulorum]
MALRVVYRSWGGENEKNRPPGYSKLTCLVSFLRAAEAVDADVVFLNDGPVAPALRGLMDRHGKVVELEGSGMRASYWGAISLAVDSDWDDDDVVWFSEDDYLYHPEAFTALVAAADGPEAVPAQYFALYGSTPDRSVHGPDEPTSEPPPGWVQLGPFRSEGRDWVRMQSTTSTLGARLGALREDKGIFKLCMYPHKNMLRDHDTCVAIQGFSPYRPYDLVHPLYERGRSLKMRVRDALILPFLLATVARALTRRPERRRTFLAVEPNLATHMEVLRIASGTDWDAVAADAQAWGTERGLLTADGISA